MSKKFQLVRSTDSPPERKMFFVLFGYPGIGKTSLSFTMPNPCIHLDFDRGIDRAVQKIRPDYYSIQSFADFNDFVNSKDFEATVKENGYKTVIIDTVGTLLDDFIAPALIAESPKNGNRSGGLTLAGWGALSNSFNLLKGRFQSLDLHICAICHAKEEGDDVKQVRLSVKGGSTDILYRNADMIGFMYPHGSKRVVDFNPTELHIGKNITDIPAINVPHYTEQGYDTFLSDIIEKCYSRMSEANEAQLKFKAELAEWKDYLQQCTSETDFDEFGAKVKAEVISVTMKTTLGNLYAATLRDRGLAFNKETGKVEQILKPETAKT